LLASLAASLSPVPATPPADATGASATIVLRGFVPSSCRVTAGAMVGCNAPTERLVVPATGDYPAVLTVRPTL
jgi:hypothetical protein